MSTLDKNPTGSTPAEGSVSLAASSAQAVPRPAASMILVREGRSGPEALMGVRGKKAAFMPRKRVFPGGSVEHCDLTLTSSESLSETCLARLEQETSAPDLSRPLGLAAIRETFEETGLALGVPGDSAAGIPEGSWKKFYGLGLHPALSRMRFMFRAITPATLPIRFDARFFLASADAVHGGDGAVVTGSGELEDMGWVSLREAEERDDLPRITRLVLREALEVVEGGDKGRKVPFYAEGGGEAPRFLL